MRKRAREWWNAASRFQRTMAAVTAALFAAVTVTFVAGARDHWWAVALTLTYFAAVGVTGGASTRRKALVTVTDTQIAFQVTHPDIVELSDTKGPVLTVTFAEPDHVIVAMNTSRLPPDKLAERVRALTEVEQDAREHPPVKDTQSEPERRRTPQPVGQPGLAGA